MAIGIAGLILMLGAGGIVFFAAWLFVKYLRHRSGNDRE